MTITVNGKEHAFPVELAEKNLATWLREDLLLTGTKIGCDIGVCGSCTVLINDVPSRSCKVKLKEAAGKSVLTIEGVTAKDGTLHPIQQAFVDCGAIQCGFCTPGMVLSTYAFLKANPHPTREQARTAIKGNICRCTGYQQIIDAILAAAEIMR
ncbi:MAG: (2Fe-2S)-binding protein [Candidatus Cloacimonas sp.]|jgi:carbon-monoxide dehydrogenase small subunit|nr:(2Fe-2S)-binding protein [Candidatus Cloacimonas sp.]